MWEKLVAHYEAMDEPGVRLAQVNCATHGGALSLMSGGYMAGIRDCLEVN